MKKRSISFLGFWLMAIFLYQNCSQTPFGKIEFGSMDELEVAQGEVNALSNPIALLSAEQIFKSMASVTGVTPTGPIVNEYNARQPLFASGYDATLVTSPMLTGAANVASTFCNELVTREMAKPAAERSFMSSVDFTKPASNLSDDGYSSVLESFSVDFWGRSISEEEVEILKTARVEFMAGLTEAEQRQAASSRNLMLFTCSAMLASFDSLTF